MTLVPDAAAVEAVFREEYGRVLAGLVRLLGDFDRAEDALQEAFAAALTRWPRDGLPQNPGGWLSVTARNRALDALRREKNYRSKLEAAAQEQPMNTLPPPGTLDDDLLTLIFTCCHPALSTDAQIALTLKSVAGLSTRQIASALLLPEPTLAQRLVRVKHKIRDAGIAFKTPPPERRAERLDAVLLVVYLVFNEGYSASSGDSLTSADLSSEAIYLGRTLAALLPGEAEVLGLLALMLLQDSRRDARTDDAGDLVVLDEQDRSRWDRGQIAEGLGVLERALSAGGRGRYVLQAYIAAQHALAPAASRTNWHAVARAYEDLLQLVPTPVVALNHAAAVAMATTPEAGLELMDRLAAEGELDRYYLLHASRADLLRRSGRNREAAATYRQALALCTNPVEQRFLRRRLAEVES